MTPPPTRWQVALVCCAVPILVVTFVLSGLWQLATKDD